ncbi:pilus assembly protein PilS [Lelliottia amnigena]|uniref:type 4 pilus major pilin n=1 Tax=Lelliottia amnigena TaxID=61646 RepID=UPI0010386D87|nr:type 4 pilus major pilin [Lelliottia amnigena]TCD12256.1 pilus assembly protein PilS [Lelliottia amnigena]
MIKNLKKGVMQVTDAQIGWGMLIVGLIAVMTYGATLIFKSNSTTDLSTYSLIMNEMSGLRPSTGYGTTDYTATLIKKDVLPKTIQTSGGTKILNRNGGEITVVGAGNGFTLSTAGIGQGDCIDAAAHLSIGKVTTTKINGTSFNGEVTAPAASAACTSGSTNTLAFTTSS